MAANGGNFRTPLTIHFLPDGPSSVKPGSPGASPRRMDFDRNTQTSTYFATQTARPATSATGSLSGQTLNYTRPQNVHGYCGYGGCRVELRLPLLQCPMCDKAKYCSRQCQNKAWKGGHRNECEARGAGQPHSWAPKAEHMPNSPRTVNGDYDCSRTLKPFHTQVVDERAKEKEEVAAVEARLNALFASHAWRDIVDMQSEALEAAEALEDKFPASANDVYSKLATAYRSLGVYHEANKYHELSLRTHRRPDGLISPRGRLMTELYAYDGDIKARRNSPRGLNVMQLGMEAAVAGEFCKKGEAAARGLGASRPRVAAD